MATGNATLPMLVLDRYRVEAQPGESNPGTMVRAYDTRLKQFVTIETRARTAPGEDADRAEELRERLATEAAAGARIGPHPQIVAVLDSVTDADETVYLVREYMPGGTLADRLRRGEPLSLTEAVTITTDIARGLMAAHDAGIVHRDVRPGTIFLTADGHAKLGDFGSAQIDDRPQPIQPMRLPVGAPLYLSPEQARLTDPLGPSSDQYSLGLVCFEMLTGVAFKRLEPTEAWARAAWQPPAVFACVKRMLMDAPAERYPTMATAILALDRIARALNGDETRPAPFDPLMLSPATAPEQVPASVDASADGSRQSVVGSQQEVPPAEESVVADPPPVAPPQAAAAEARVRASRRAFLMSIGGLILVALLGVIVVPQIRQSTAGVRPVATAPVTGVGVSVTPTNGATVAPTVLAVGLASLPPTLPTQPAPTATSRVLAPTVTAVPTVAPTVTPPRSPTPASGAPAGGGAAGAPGGAATPAMGVAISGAPVTTAVPQPTATAPPPATATPLPPAPPPPPLPPTPAPPTPEPPTPVPPTPEPPTPAPPTPTPEPPTATPQPQPPMLGIHSVGTTNRSLTQVAPEDSLMQFTVGQEVFGWINYGGATPGQDTLDATVTAGAVIYRLLHISLVQPDGFAVFSLGSLPAGQYTLQVSYRGSVVQQNSTFAVAAQVIQPTPTATVLPTPTPTPAPPTAPPMTAPQAEMAAPPPTDVPQGADMTAPSDTSPPPPASDTPAPSPPGRPSR